MRPGEMFLSLIANSPGGKISSTQVDTWLKSMISQGLVQIVPEGEGDQLKVYYVITEEGRKRLSTLERETEYGCSCIGARKGSV